MIAALAAHLRASRARRVAHRRLAAEVTAARRQLAALGRASTKGDRT